MSTVQESEDEKLAKQLQEEWNKGINMALDIAKMQTTMEQDLLLAKKIMEEDSKGTSSESGSKESEKDVQKMQQVRKYRFFIT
jgi:hypothetical protein